MVRDIVLDLETLGVVPGCAIMSIGAVVVDLHMQCPEGSLDCITDEFYAVVNKQSCLDAGLWIEPATLGYWNNKPEAEKDILGQIICPSISEPLLDCLSDLRSFIRKDDIVWSNGANFDQPILAVAFEKVGLEMPWKYYNGLCYRTVRRLKNDREKIAVPHHALEDAKIQAVRLHKLLKDT